MKRAAKEPPLISNDNDAVPDQLPQKLTRKKAAYRKEGLSTVPQRLLNFACLERINLTVYAVKLITP